jgi:peptide/nickel transport system permease protein
VTRFLVRRLALSLLVLALVTSATFVATLQLGDPTAMLLGAHATAEDREHVRRFYGLDRPVTTQLAMYIGHMARGDLGTSYRYHRPVAALIGERLPRTLLLGAMALALQTSLGVALGSLAAVRHGRASDGIIMGGTFVAMSLPDFLTGTLLLLGVAYWLGWFPIGGYGVGAGEHLRAAVLPAFTLAVGGTAFYARLTRDELIEALRADYVRTALAKGASRARALVYHALRNSLTPVIADLGASVGSLLGGAVLVETVFAWPGLGKLAVEAVTGLDVPVIVGCVIVGTLGILVGNVLGDVGCAVVDPRIRKTGD